MASALEGLGIAAQEQQDIESAREYFQRSLSLHRDLDLNPESAVSLIYLSMLALGQDELDTAEAMYRESIDRFKEDNPEYSLIPPLLTLGDVAFSTHDSVQIAELLRAAHAVFGASRLKRSWDSAMIKLGGVAQRRHVSKSALEGYRHTLSVDPARDEWGSEAIACLGLGCVAYRQDRPKIGKTLIARSLNLCRTHGDVDTILYVLSYASAYTYRCQHYPGFIFNSICSVPMRRAIWKMRYRLPMRCVMQRFWHTGLPRMKMRASTAWSAYPYIVTTGFRAMWHARSLCSAQSSAAWEISKQEQRSMKRRYPQPLALQTLPV